VPLAGVEIRRALQEEKTKIGQLLMCLEASLSLQQSDGFGSDCSETTTYEPSPAPPAPATPAPPRGEALVRQLVSAKHTLCELSEELESAFRCVGALCTRVAARWCGLDRQTGAIVHSRGCASVRDG
jgi:hypothetical protein